MISQQVYHSLLVLAASSFNCLAAPLAAPYLIKDLNPSSGNLGSDPTAIAVVGDVGYFVAKDILNDYQLRRTDGTPEGTSIVVKYSDLVPANLTPWGSHLYFSTKTINTAKLWRTDGTAAGTEAVKDFMLASTASGIGGFTLMDGLMYFVASDPATGNELWRTDGTEEGTWMVKDIRPGADPSSPRGFAVAGNTLYFVADDGENGLEVWKSDGTEAGTALVKVIAPSWVAYPPRELRALGDQVVFVADDGTAGIELWISDGTETGTRMVLDLRPGSRGGLGPDGKLMVMGNEVYFPADSGTFTGFELWKSDGTSEGTSMVMDINPDSSSSNPTPHAVVGSRLLFTASDGRHGTEFWSTDGTAAGTFMMPEIKPGSGPLSVWEVVVSGSNAFITTSNSTTGVELWRSNGTIAGTSLVKDIQPGSGSSFPQFLTPFRGGVLFSADDGATGKEIWKSDGTNRGTNLVKDVQPSAGDGLVDVENAWAVLEDILYFAGHDPETGSELWRSDGTSEGTWMVADINPGTDSSTPLGFQEVGGVLYFTAHSPDYGGELWRTDGTSEGTLLVKDIISGEAGTFTSHLTAHKDLLFFRANDGINGFELWRSDGTAAGTSLLRDIYPGSRGSLGSIQGHPVSMGDHVFFPAETSDYGIELWRSDGSAAGTSMVRDLYPGSTGSEPFLLTAGDDVLYFAARVRGNGTELWQSNGTATGTRVVRNIGPEGASGLGPGSAMTLIGSQLIFAADDGTHGRELWSSNGTHASTQMLVDIRLGSEGSSPKILGTHGDKVFFNATDGDSAYDLWVTDGSAAGTSKVRPVADGGPLNSARGLTTEGPFFFTAGLPSSTGGFPLWSSDGTAASTNPVPPVDGIDIAVIRHVMATSDKVFMSVLTLEYGLELWALDLTPVLELNPVLELEHPPGTGLPETGGEVVWDLTGPGTPTKTFVIRNSGASNLNGLRVELDPPDNDAFEISTQDIPATLEPNSETSLTITRRRIAGSGPTRLLISSSDESVSPFSVQFVELLPEPTLSWDPTAAVLNRQTGLFELQLTLTNGYATDISGFEIQVGDLLPGVTIHGASPEGEIQYPGSIPAGESVTLLLEFHSPTRILGDFAPQIRAEISDEPMPPVAANGMAVNRVEWLGDALLVEFQSIAGRRYQIDYRDPSAEWKTSPMLIEATSNRVQFIDRGPPHTDSPPTQVSSRMYRFSELE